MFTYTICGLQYNSKPGYYKQMRTKHEKEKRYIFMMCNTSFSKKLNHIKHIRHEIQISILKSKLICSFKECNTIFTSFKAYQLHLNIRHMVDINNDTLNFEIFEGNNNVNSNLYIIKYLIINIILRN